AIPTSCKIGRGTRSTEAPGGSRPSTHPTRGRRSSREPIEGRPMHFPRISTLKTATDFRHRLQALGVTMPFDETLQTGPDPPPAHRNRRPSAPTGTPFGTLPMEGWDGTEDGRPSDLTRRRWRHFGLSGAKLIWGGEAVAVRHDGRANPNQLVLKETTLPDIAA